MVAFLQESFEAKFECVELNVLNWMLWIDCVIVLPTIKKMILDLETRNT